MTIRHRFAATLGILLAAATVWTGAAEALAPESKRLTRARDFIADEQWALAIEQLRAAVDDQKEPRRDEALYWLAHSQYHSGDPASSVATISRLERDFPKSMWVKNGQSLRIEIAVRLERRDVLWWTAMAPDAPVVVTVPPRARRGMRGESPSPQPAPKAPPARPITDVQPEVPGAPKASTRIVQPALPPQPPPTWMADFGYADAELRILALGGLMRLDDVDRVVPILGKIALEGEPGPAVRAVFMLAQSPSPKARDAVVRVAKTASEPVQVAAVRDLGRFGGPEISKELLSVYTTATLPVKMQIVNTFGERAERTALLHIVQSEKDGKLRFRAISRLGQAGGVVQLAGMYSSASVDGKRSIIGGLFIARAEDELIRIAESEKTANQELCGEAQDHLRLLGTPKARAYLQNVAKRR